MCIPVWICCGCAVRYVLLIVSRLLHVLSMAEDLGQKWVLPNLYQADWGISVSTEGLAR